MIKRGKIIRNNVKLEKHEDSAVRFLAGIGHNIELIKPSNIPHLKNADLILDGSIWEIKSPQGNSRYCIERLFRKAAKQSSNIIIDLRYLKINDADSIKTAVRLFNTYRCLRKIKIITKKREVIDLKKK